MLRRTVANSTYSCSVCGYWIDGWMDESILRIGENTTTWEATSPNPFQTCWYQPTTVQKALLRLPPSLTPSSPMSAEPEAAKEVGVRHWQEKRKIQASPRLSLHMASQEPVQLSQGECWHVVKFSSDISIFTINWTHKVLTCYLIYLLYFYSPRI